MVVILSDETDESTNQVIDWIHFFGWKFLRINPSDQIDEVTVSDWNVSIRLNDRVVDLSEVTAYWYRRGWLNLKFPPFGDDFALSSKLNLFLRRESGALQSFVMKALRRKRCIGDYFRADINKLDVLTKAETLGLRVPRTIVTSAKRQLIDFIRTHGQVITKPIRDVVMGMDDDISYVTYTRRIGIDEAVHLEDTFAPSLFQEEITKRYELRIFFVKNDFYSMAIFSQLDQKTAVDFREYNRQKPNRNVPYILPQALVGKLRYLMADCQLDTGSIDVIVDTNGEYFFLEVNPVGQYDMVSAPCNYHLHKRIAEYLCFG